MKLSIIAALTQNRVIGKNGAVPWDLPEDIRRFKNLTFGYPVLMGRKTYETLSEPLIGRRNIVITSKKNSDVETFSSIDSALKELQNQERVWIIGGGKIFEQMLMLADEWKLTHVKKETEGDTFFPPYEHLIGSAYKLVFEEKHNDFVFRDYEKR